MCPRCLRILVFCLVVGGALVLSAEDPTPVSEAGVAGIIRRVNTAQVNWKAKHGTYADLWDLAKNKLLADSKVPLNIKEHDTATIWDYELRVVVPSDRHHYMTALTKENGCGVAMFSSESAVIYRAKALGCE